MVVLATKLYVEGEARERALDSLRSLVDNEIGELEVDAEVGVRHDDFPSVTLDGPDAVVARNVLREQFGEIHPGSDLEPGETYVGTLDAWDEDGFVLDAGQPVRIPADGIGLGPGSPSQIRERFGLVQHVPLRFVYGGDGATDTDGGADNGATDTDGGADNGAADADGGAEDGAAEADGAADESAADQSTRLADEERDRLFEWTRGDGRLNVNSATRAEVRATLNRAGHAQDYVTVERLGLLEQSVVCTEDTDPPGLLASVGEYLPSELRCVVP